MIGWAGETLIATSLLLIAVLLLRQPVARLFGARAAYALWLAPLVRMFLPPLPHGGAIPDISIYRVAGFDGATPAQALGPFSQWLSPLILLWLGGALLFLLIQLALHRRFISAALAAGRQLESPVAGMDLIESPAVGGPIAAGILKRRIFLPSGFEDRLTPVQQEYALAHELLHHRRGDLAALALSMLLLALHWFNPIAHIAHRLFRADLESACDAQLIGSLRPDEGEEYARTIIACASANPPRAICTLTTIDDLKRRLTMLQHRHGLLARTAGLGFAGMLAIGGLTLASQVAAHPGHDGTQKTEVHKIVVHGKDGDKVPAEIQAKIDKCDGEKVEATADAGNANRKEQVKILICGDKGSSPAQMADKLEKAVTHIQAETELPADHKARIVAQLQAKIAELRAQ